LAVNATPPAPSWLRRNRSTRMPREVIVLGLIAFCVAVGFGVLIPVLPVFARSFGVDNFAVGAVVSVFALMRLVTAPFCGRMINRAGERVILALGIFIVAVSSGLAGISQSYPQLLLLRGVGGFGSAMFTVAATTLLLTSVEAGLRGRASGVFQAGFLIGGMRSSYWRPFVSHLADRAFFLLRRHIGRGGNCGPADVGPLGSRPIGAGGG
jgi:MFS family permease